MSGKHTPGPWSVPHFAEAGNCQCGYVFSDSQTGMGSICTVDWGGENETKEVASANARVIAAAPELLEALQDLLARNNSANRLKAYTAIAKATGESQ